jgi:hypothetical protein
VATVFGLWGGRRARRGWARGWSGSRRGHVAGAPGDGGAAREKERGHGTLTGGSRRSVRERGEMGARLMGA